MSDPITTATPSALPPPPASPGRAAVRRRTWSRRASLVVVGVAVLLAAGLYGGRLTLARWLDRDVDRAHVLSGWWVGETPGRRVEFGFAVDAHAAWPSATGRWVGTWQTDRLLGGADRRTSWGTFSVDGPRLRIVLEDGGWSLNHAPPPTGPWIVPVASLTDDRLQFRADDGQLVTLFRRTRNPADGPAGMRTLDRPSR